MVKSVFRRFWKGRLAGKDLEGRVEMKKKETSPLHLIRNFIRKLEKRKRVL